MSQTYLNLLVRISSLKPLEQVNTNFATLLANIVSQIDKVQRKMRQINAEKSRFTADRISSLEGTISQQSARIKELEKLYLQEKAKNENVKYLSNSLANKSVDDLFNDVRY